ncbi:imidazole glycerol phosphate synthase subunit HisH [Pyrococcus furiosus DSM 3638]|uniref:Imidazole glycerol phosphate synthase subunit HisH n=3 Tax=Pyrococcus furiosus TaxID=2261 RepID=HIS5_PYRFU|nr:MULTISPECIES: imidazole glycerol phosphate synthase subunit HisH [Pyrococcus]P58789.1 RecName: Full=Imidazole glycerol phosphate synthase subunit HisH; AltName: Full=IGP synthase glutaminase subunit; AltName: Full=IGP synthase subunit HisH; AltName: Full=ImGP synthase subunit HisH; Short=IGPS subunit HisH [Pyrococcus furiosus DSM 3638]AAL81785.1 glutamine amidotransferase [Pyrococcus furiosus DSM 3638]AFN04979.1 imidazole glycerol phosphate synthase subunit HisH [Pyrococcus furiosus COM1]MDK
MDRIAIVDLGIGNLANVKKALKGYITSDPYEIEKADKIVLPGVGNFGAVVDKLAPIKDIIIEGINEGKPFLGICLGMQLLFEESEESPGKEGLGIFKGKVVKLKNVRTPHIGWNQVWIKKECKLFEGLKNGSYFYFVHSYHAVPQDPDIIATTTDYENAEFVSSVCFENIFGVQFHPEKSSKNGLILLRNFRRL